MLAGAAGELYDAYRGGTAERASITFLQMPHSFIGSIFDSSQNVVRIELYNYSPARQIIRQCRNGLIYRRSALPWLLLIHRIKLVALPLLNRINIDRYIYRGGVLAGDDVEARQRRNFVVASCGMSELILNDPCAVLSDGSSLIYLFVQFYR